MYHSDRMVACLHFATHFTARVSPCSELPPFAHLHRDNQRQQQRGLFHARVCMHTYSHGKKKTILLSTWASAAARTVSLVPSTQQLNHVTRNTQTQ